MELDLINLVGSLGFPIVCTGYLLTRFDNTLKQNTEVINNLSTTIQLLVAKLEKNNE